MGWDYTQGASKQDIVNQILNSYHPTSHRLEGNALWLVIDGKPAKAELRRNGKWGWGYRLFTV